MDVLTRIWEDLISRIGGPMSLRLFLQPAMALFFGIRDGLKDARAGRPAYLWTIFTDPTARSYLLHEGWKAMVKVFRHGHRHRWDLSVHRLSLVLSGRGEHYGFDSGLCPLLTDSRPGKSHRPAMEI